jgi:hypothetical protein
VSRRKFRRPEAIPAIDPAVLEVVRSFSTLAESSPPALRADDAVVRATGIFGLGAVAVIHFSQVVATIDQTPWLGAAFVALTLACMVLAGRLLQRGSRLLWAQVAVVNIMAIGGYTFTRLVSTPFDNTDVGNWSEMLGLAALFIEGALVMVSVQVIVGLLRAPGRLRPARAGRSLAQAGVSAEGAADPVTSYWAPRTQSL